jgi:long-subunit acyl-CoA synthetase (AMP-forming)
MPASQEDVEGPPLGDLEAQSVGALISARAAIEPQRAAVRSRLPSGKWIDLGWAALDEKRRSLAAGLRALGVVKGDRVAVVSANSVEMLLAELAIVTLGAVSVPIFPEYAIEILQHCLLDSGARIAFAGTAAQQHRLAACKTIEQIIVLDDQPLAGGIKLGALDSGADAQDAFAAVSLDDPAFQLYTSGTTGRPKGVPLTHRNVLSQQAALSQVWDVSERDVFLSYLPWHHCFGALFERMMALWHRALLVLDDSRGRDLDRLLENFAEVKPTVYFSVPRVFQALVARASADERVLRALVHGGLRFVFTAAAPLDAHCYRFFETHGVPVHEGWGLTETSPCVTVTRPGDARAAGVAGSPLPGTSVRFEPQEMGNQIVVRGPQVMRGYWKADSSEVLSADGWLRTGDLGEWTPQGLRVLGRIDGVFKLQNGEKVASAGVEARLLAATPLLEQATVLGSGQPFVTALCWISEPAARRWLEDRSLEVPGSLASAPELRRAIVEALQAANQVAPIGYERVRRVALVDEPLKPEEGELTPSLKVVRGTVIRRHAALVAAMIDEDHAHPAVLELHRRGDAFHNA